MFLIPHVQKLFQSGLIFQNKKLTSIGIGFWDHVIYPPPQIVDIILSIFFNQEQNVLSCWGG